MQLGNLKILPALDQLDQVSLPTKKFLSENQNIAKDVSVAVIDPNFSDTANFCSHYEVPTSQTVNCVIVEATRADRKWLVACLVLGTTRVDVNGLVRKHLGARKVSFAAMDTAVKESGMEYGGITAVGLPETSPILIDSKIAALDAVVLGSGVRGSKLVTSGKTLAQLPNAVLLENLGREVIANT